ncbi:MAG: glycosyltransferase [Candidatus Krumholzibacteria bacterium]|nr:glycosyltransferase [Candidatus Krumholzibacteria bacterium]MDH4336136.1 glycosyltransferase [Candidatus Krumholzibacteria bacterium]MDH5268777.1 glycosyltransferase [Candidatus Krumholzibacteria bacterium]
MSVPDVSLVIAVYQRDDFLTLVLTSLLDQTLRNFEAIIADDGSGPPVAEVIESFQGALAHPILHVRHDDDGFRKTIIVNRAVTRARADFLVFIDGDCILHRRFLERHYRRRRRRLALSGRRVMFDRELTERLTTDDVRSRRIQHIPFWWKHAGRIDRWNGFYLPFMHRLRNIRRADYELVGSNFSLNREDFFRVNGYDERIVGRGLEDNNLRARLLNSGVAVGTITREALQYHMFHTADPMPHSREFIDKYRWIGEARTPHGIEKE